MSDETETPPPAEEEKPSSGGVKRIVLVGALVGGLLAGAGAGMFALGPMLARKSGYVVDPTLLAAADSAKANEAPTSKGGEEGKEGESTSTIHTIDNIILNPAGSGGSRFLMLQAAIDAKEGSTVEELKTRDAEARDVVLRVMGAKTVEQLSDMRNRERFKQELIDSLGALFKKKGAIRRIYFPQFVIQ
jgi:flagellar FliL protein